MEIKTKIKEAEKITETNPTEKQKEAGNYKKGKVAIKGLSISIENPVGSIREGEDELGNKWKNTMTFTYGYFLGTIGKDGEPVDVFIGKYVDGDFDVYVVDQVDEKTGIFDEHKVMFGFKDEESAKKAYFSNYSKGWQGFGNITQISLDKFKLWVYDSKATKHPISKLSMRQKIDYKNELKDSRVKLIKLFGDIEEGKTLKNLQEQAGDINEFEDLVCEIASSGGSVSEGLEIMVWFDKLSSIGKTITTLVSANAYSIASLIMLAADYRLISKHGEIMVHNPMLPELKYADADALEKHALGLRNLERMMYKIYQMFTGISREKIKTLMDKETFLSPQEAVKLGFADLVVDIKPKPYMAAINTKKTISMSKTINILNKVIGLVNGADIISQFYYDSTGIEIEVYQSDPSGYSVGDRTNIENGNVMLADGATLKVENYVIADIEKAVVAPVDENEGAAPKEPLVKAEAKAKETPAEKKEKTVEGVKVEEKAEVKAVEKAEEKVEEKKEVEKTESVAKLEEKKKEKVKEVVVVEKVEEENYVAQLKEQVESTQGEVAQLKEELIQIKSDAENMNKVIAAFGKFEETATEAIDVLAKNTVSQFKPDPKEVAEKTATGSIFQKLKKERGLK